MWVTKPKGRLEGTWGSHLHGSCSLRPPQPSSPTFYLPSHRLKSSLQHPDQKGSPVRLSLTSRLSLPPQGLLGRFPVPPSCATQGKCWLSTWGWLGPGSWEGWEKRSWSHPRCSPCECFHNSRGCNTSLSTGIRLLQAAGRRMTQLTFPLTGPSSVGALQSLHN